MEPNEAAESSKGSDSVSSPSPGSLSPSVSNISTPPPLPMPQPLPPSLLELKHRSATFEWVGFPHCSSYLLDMATVPDRSDGFRGDKTTRGPSTPRLPSPKTSPPPRIQRTPSFDGDCMLVGESLNWAPVYSGVETNHTVSGLHPGRNYWFRVRYIPAVDGPSGTSSVPPPSLPAMLVTPFSTPSAPGSLTLAQRARTTLKVRWAPPADTGGKPIQAHVLEMRPPPSARGEESSAAPRAGEGAVEVYRGPEMACKVTRLVPGHEYSFRVRAANAVGHGPWLGPLTFATAPSVPLQPAPPTRVAATSSSITVEWKPPVSCGAPISRYTLEVDNGHGGPFTSVYAGEECMCEIQGLVSGCTYRCRVRAENQCGQGVFSLPADVTTAVSEPLAPAAPAVMARTPTTSTFSWNPPERDGGRAVSGYQLEVYYRMLSDGGESGGGAGWLLAYEGTARGATVSNLRPGTSYRARLRAHNDIGTGPYSTEVTFTTASAAPEAPQAPLLVDRTSYSLTLKWHPPFHDGGGVITGYRVEMQPAEHYGRNGESQGAGGAKPAIVYSGGETTAVIDGLGPGVRYCLRLQAANKFGGGSWSAPAVLETLPGLPSAPTHLTLGRSSNSLSPTSVALAWGPAAPNGSLVTAYRLQAASPVLRPTFEETASLAAFDERGEEEEAVKQVRENGVGNGLAGQHGVANGGEKVGSLRRWLEEVQRGLPKQVAPWTGEEGAVAGEADMDFEDIYVGLRASHTASELTPHTVCAFRVQALNSVGCGPWSQLLLLRTPSAAPEAPPAPQVAETSQTSITVQWEAPSRDNGSPVESYSLQMSRPRRATPSGPSQAKSSKARGKGPGAPAAAPPGNETWEEMFRGPAKEWCIEQLQAGQGYLLRVVAYNRMGGSAPSRVLAAHTDPAPPVAPPAPSCAAPTPTTIKLRWQPPPQDNGDPVKSYKLSADDGAGGAFHKVYEGAATKYTATRLLPGRTYRFRIQAINSVGSSHVSEQAVACLPQAPPAPPSAPEVAPRGAHAARVSWQWLNTAEADSGVAKCLSFTLEMEERGSSLPKTVYQGSRNGCEVTGLEANTTYHFRVRANGPSEAGSSSWTAAVAHTTEAEERKPAARTQAPTVSLWNSVESLQSQAAREWEKRRGLKFRRVLTAVGLAVTMVAVYLGSWELQPVPAS